LNVNTRILGAVLMGEPLGVPLSGVSWVRFPTPPHTHVTHMAFHADMNSEVSVRVEPEPKLGPGPRCPFCLVLLKSVEWQLDRCLAHWDVDIADCPATEESLANFVGDHAWQDSALFLAAYGPPGPGVRPEASAAVDAARRAEADLLHRILADVAAVDDDSDQGVDWKWQLDRVIAHYDVDISDCPTTEEGLANWMADHGWSEAFLAAHGRPAPWVRPEASAAVDAARRGEAAVDAARDSDEGDDSAAVDAARDSDEGDDSEHTVVLDPETEYSLYSIPEEEYYPNTRSFKRKHTV
jgi:hypothetical protein